jgi:hypothetical protein
MEKEATPTAAVEEVTEEVLEEDVEESEEGSAGRGRSGHRQ